MNAANTNSPSYRAPRIPMEVAVVLEGHAELPGAERTFTENVSARGARIVSVRRWAPNDRLTVLAPAGKFRSKARVAYCQSLRGEGYAIGVEFLDPAGRWVVQS
ncbi:MAG: PilZ domain-containing protein [Acidobacteriia bacterium]|nr:PilZ domain-containing protein [Terriglobia bacterium]